MLQAPGIFSDGKSAKHHACNLVLTNDSLLIYLIENDNQLIIWNFNSIVDCHLNGSSLIITYGSYPHQSIECSGNFSAELYNKWSGKKIIKNAEGLVYKGKSSVAVGLIILFFGLLFLSYFYLVPWAGRKAAGLIPIEAEIELGNSIAQMYSESFEQNDTLHTLLNAFVSQLKIKSPYAIDANIIISDQINAFALPGGKIFVYSGIIQKMSTYEELVALLGHEMTHVVNQHSLKSICSSAASGIVIAALFGDITGISSAVISQADQFKQLNYSRELETEADNDGYNLMLQNKINPIGMINLLKLLKEEGSAMPDMMKYLSTHPDTDSRIENIKLKPTTKIVFESNTTLEALFQEIKKQISNTTK